MSHGERAEHKANQHKEFSGKDMNKKGWYSRGAFTKKLTHRLQRIFGKKEIKNELPNL